MKSHLIHNNRCVKCASKQRTKPKIQLPQDYKPIPGETRRGYEINFQSGVNFIWASCEVCGKYRWVTIRHGKPDKARCLKCATSYPTRDMRGSRNHFWRGGKIIDKNGYIHIKLQPEDFFYKMADTRGYVKEHRLVVAKNLSRCLLPWEVVHHKDGNRQNNEMANLELLPHNKYHLPDSATKQYIHKLERKIAELERRISVVK